MDVIFVNAVYFWNEDSINIGQAILKDILKDEYKVECINFDYLCKTGEFEFTENFQENISRMGDYLIEREPKILGFYTICNAFIITLKLAEYIKKKDPNIKIAFGGPQGSITSEDCLRAFSFIDVICLGEAELSIKLLVDVLINGGNLSKVPGISYIDNGDVVVTGCTDLIKDEDFAKYIVYDYSPIKINPKIPFMIEGGRGCPFGCTFCTTSNFWKKKYRVKDISVLINEIIEINKMYGVKEFSILHDMFTANRERILEFCHRIIDLDLPIKWKCSSRIDVLDQELMDMMIDSNCSSIYIGIETGSQRMQGIINKKLNLKSAVDKISYLHKKGVLVTTSFIYCFPDEKIEDFKDTIEMMESFIYEGIYNVQLHRFIPLPGTEETNKIKNIMFYDPKVLETTMNIVRLTDEISDVIIKYPSIFSQYYTFDSEVKKKYKRFDIFMECISVINGFYNNTLKLLINMYGLETIYFDLEHVLDNLYLSKQNEKENERISKDLHYDAYSYNKIFVSYFKNKISSDNNLYRELFKYDYHKFMYWMSKETKPKILKFNMNIEKAIKNQIEEVCNYYLMYSLREGTVYTTHVIPKHMA